MLYLFSSEERAKLAIQYVDQESLYHCLDPIMDDIDHKLTKETNKIENWTDAKALVAQIFQSKHPECLVQIKLEELKSEYDCLSSRKRGDNFCGSELMTNLTRTQILDECYVVLLYAYAIVHYLFMTQKNDAVIRTQGAIIKQISNYNAVNSFAPFLTAAINNGIDYNMIVNDYDYKSNELIEMTEEKLENAETILSKYKDDPIYGQCYEGVVNELSLICRYDVSLDIHDYVKVFMEADRYVERVLNSKFKEIEISKVHSDIMKQYPEIENRQGNLIVTIKTPERKIGYVIEQVFMIALWDKMTKKTKLEIKQFEDIREFINYHYYPNPYTGSHLWKLLAERLPEIKEKPRTEDLLVRIQHLENELSKDLRAGMDVVIPVLVKLINNASKDPLKVSDTDKAQLIEKLTGYKSNGISSKITNMKKEDLNPSEEKKQEVYELLSKCGISSS